jgi:hypothetical protein
VLLTTKGYFPLNTCENVWICRLLLRLDPKLVSPSRKTLYEEIIPSMVDKGLALYVWPLIHARPTTTTKFDLWMNRR